jgi:putative tryptophan/tyrosine transport system substrate-binding protein
MGAVSAGSNASRIAIGLPTNLWRAEMRRREFIAGLGSATAWPLAARAQQSIRMRRIGVMLALYAADDPEGLARVTAFVQGLQERGWTDGRNARIEYRWGLGDADRQRRYAYELAALAPDVVLAGGGAAVAAFQQASSSLPVVFANVDDPVGAGFVASLARPGGNATGFMAAEFGQSAKLIALLKQVAPQVTRAAVFRSPNSPNSSSELSQYAAIQAVAPSLRMEVTPLGHRDAKEIERGIAAFAREPNGGVIASGQMTKLERDQIIALAALHRLPAVYPFRGFVTAGGLISFGSDQAEPYRLAAGYVDRILKGEKAADLPVQAPTKFETVINLKTANALGLTIPETLLATADEVIQ